MKWRRIGVLVPLAAFAPPAWAHGSEAFVLIYGGAHALYAFAVSGLALLVPALRACRRGVRYGALAGVVATWLGPLVGLGNESFLVAGLVFPIVGTLAGGFVHKRLAERSPA